MTDPSPAHYPERVVVFIDILGFARDVQRIEEGQPGLFLSIQFLLSAVAKCKRDLDARRDSNNVRFDARMTHVSDALILSCSVQRGGCRWAISQAAFLGVMCIRRGYLPRGVITIGRLIHDDAVLFGAGLINAYNMERSAVHEPRIAVDAPVMTQIRNEFALAGQIGEVASFVRNRGSGDFVHLLGEKWPFLTAEVGDETSDMFDELRQMLPLRYSNAQDDRQRSKIEWMSEYVNDTIAERELPADWKVVLPGTG
jgi:hypothetical protein